MVDLYPYTRTLVPLRDGGQISLDWIQHPDVDQNFDQSTPIVALLPGLTGNRYCGYVKALIGEVCRRKFKCVVLNHRGCSQTPLTTRKRRVIMTMIAQLYCATSIGDTKAGVTEIMRLHPNNPLYAIGVSFGSNLLGNVSAMF